MLLLATAASCRTDYFLSHLLYWRVAIGAYRPLLDRVCNHVESYILLNLVIGREIVTSSLVITLRVASKMADTQCWRSTAL